MDVDDLLVVASDGGLSALLHPLVILNISDHLTRRRAEAKSHNVTAYGALFGKQAGRVVEIFNSFELLLADGIWDLDFLNTRTEAFKRIFKDQDCLGWYATGSHVTADHLALHRQLLGLNEAPFFLLLDDQAQATREQLPITIFETIVELKDDEQHIHFAPTPYKLASEEAERIGVDHIANVSASAVGGQISAVRQQMQTHASALLMLQERIDVICDFLADIDAGKVQPSPALLRNIKGICSRLPVSQDPRLRAALLMESTDTETVNLLALMTQACDAIKQLTGKMQTIHPGAGKTHFASMMM
ncbi:uncharacterized protein MONBRDRAFT_32483 [Monosiga brevicollis MX1]|uniref:COP9 signalosome complex subunit 6 n=1 Tax=Monosiga brevicollis TaxID=81824 RepID=A9UZS9_MONBE|nr:uncharacterized protein MONBRDRAFT_32483 [Monosiga brevicollis MX1]EDQ89286.1 predicted protein [Monosiga brevicollis MX1]|eukprot:XP_001745862.1 hypothetical protein [Monosiga brevicollis MX1]